MYIVQTCIYMFIQVYTCFNFYKHVHTCTYMSVTYFLFTYLYVKVCTADVHCTEGYIHFMKCTDIVETCTYIDVSFWMQLFDSPGWLACRLGLAAAWGHA